MSMGLTIDDIRPLVTAEKVVISDHAYERMEESGIDPLIVVGLIGAELIEE